ncbi:MAG: trypsin-like serine peptidase [Panacagrimonas sp.]
MLRTAGARPLDRIGLVVTLYLAVSATAAPADVPCGIGRTPPPVDRQNSQPRREHDLRFVIPASEPRYRALDNVGAVYVPTQTSGGQLRKTGSGTLIDACHVLTAYHVVFPEIDLINGRPRVFQFDPRRVVMFRFGRRDEHDADGGSEFDHAIEGRPVDLGVFDPFAPNYADELLLVRLNDSAPAHYGPLRLDGDADYVPGSMDFIAAGYPLDGLSADGVYRLYGDRCAILGPDRISGYATNCSLTGGVSGGALFRVSEDAECSEPVELRLAGVPNQQDGPTLFPKDDPQRRSFVVPIARNRGVIERALAKDPCPAP